MNPVRWPLAVQLVLAFILVVVLALGGGGALLLGQLENRQLTEHARTLLMQANAASNMVAELQTLRQSLAEPVRRFHLQTGVRLLVVDPERRTIADSVTYSPLTGEQAAQKEPLVACYFAAPQSSLPIPESRPFAVRDDNPKSRATAALEECLKGPTDPRLQRAVPAGVRLLTPVEILDDTAYVNLSKEFMQGKGGDVQRALDAIVRTLTDQSSTIRKVQVLVEGKKEALLPGSTPSPVTRRLTLGLAPLDGERLDFLQKQVLAGTDAWRSDLRQTLHWEGRAFGFTPDELDQASLEAEGAQAVAMVNHEGRRYQVSLMRNIVPVPGQEGMGIWLVNSASLYVAPENRRYAPETALKPTTQRHVSIAVPEGWQVDITRSIENGDVVVLADPADPEVCVIVETFAYPHSSWNTLVDQWQFRGRNPVTIQDGKRQGVMAEGEVHMESARRQLSAGYFEAGKWEQIASAVAPTERFAEMKPLFEQILKTYHPQPDL